MPKIGFITASQAHRIMVDADIKKGVDYFGAGAKTYALEIAMQMVGVDPSDDGYVSNDMQRGIDYEPIALRQYEMDNMVAIHSRQIFRTHPELTFIGCHPDGIIGSDEVIVEVKCPNQTNHAKNILTAMQYHKEYIDQCNCSAFIIGAAKILFLSFDDRFPEGLQLSAHEFELDADWQRVFPMRAKAFWDGEVQTLIQQLTDKIK